MARPHPSRRILMIAYHFPPLTGSSGIQRTLQFVRHLPEFGWEPIVLTVHPRAYPNTSPDLLRDIPAHVPVIRAQAFDSARHFALAGRYPACLARPDRWISWLPAALHRGRQLIRTYRPRIIWSTYPIATAHAIGYRLHRASGLPWIADFRDPMAHEGYPEDPATWAAFKRIEEQVFSAAAGVSFTTPGALDFYRDRYPRYPGEPFKLIENGYAEENFAGLDEQAAAKGPLHPGRITLLHSGIVYRNERDPTHLFQALQTLRQQDLIHPDRFILRLRAHHNGDHLRTLIDRYQLQPLVELAPPLPYREALEEMLRADGLLILQAANCNQQIPAKLYEYLRARRPLLGLTDPAGDTARTLKNMGCRHLAPLDRPEQIAPTLLTLLKDMDAGIPTGPDSEVIRRYSRRQLTQTLASWLDNLSEPPETLPPP
ncbi:glycosyltransferase [Ectothiorhodospira shaposhnikovii]|uniref:glycosyltransferase n=1 Tax=Ectothiorhodospira shaposhnikovii TaxID=1054 RepID=UPI0039A3A585